MAIPGPPVFDAETSERVGQLLAKGCARTILLTTDDFQATRVHTTVTSPP